MFIVSFVSECSHTLIYFIIHAELDTYNFQQFESGSDCDLL